MRWKHRRTLAAIFETPTRSGIRWEDIESLLVALGAKMEERAGSKVAVELNKVPAVFHRPHPRPTIGKGTVYSIQVFLRKAHVEPEGGEER